jgi:hypothetical protein
MSGQTNLSTVLSSLQISCDDVQYGFATVKDGLSLPKEIIGTFHEAEGETVIASVEELNHNRIPHEGPYAKLTIEVHTSLALVGLTAVLATKLAEAGISANVVAAFYHDHIFVQFNAREKAIEVLNQLKEKSV